MHPVRAELRQRLRAARLYLIFTPSLCPGDPLGVLEAALPSVDVLQLRIKDERGQSSARELHAWGQKLLAFLTPLGSEAPPVVLNDRVDVAASLLRSGLCGVHLGQDDAPPETARQVLGDAALIGLSTHGAGDVAKLDEEPLDYLGFGPVHPTLTKGYAQGLGPQAAWVAANASELPIFPIGGIDGLNAEELAPVGRAAVCSAILSAPDPGQAARSIREALAP